MIFDRRLENWISNWRDSYSSYDDKNYIFKQRLTFKEYPISENADMGIGCRDTLGNYKEFYRMPQAEYERVVRKPVQCARIGNNLARLFFLYHWMEEQNKLTT